MTQASGLILALLLAFALGGMFGYRIGEYVGFRRGLRSGRDIFERAFAALEQAASARQGGNGDPSTSTVSERDEGAGETW